tara:strand:+ start:23 stop:406 length:384 start_codon:yes stop_codon:yes gene_type:complete
MINSQEYVLELRRINEDWIPFHSETQVLNKNHPNYEVIPLAYVKKYLGNHSTSPSFNTGETYVEFEREGWENPADTFFNEPPTATFNHIDLHNKKLYAMELILADYLNNFIIDKDEWCEAKAEREDW